MFHKTLESYSRRMFKMRIAPRNKSSLSETKSVEIPNSKTISTDMIGPPDPVSNLRKIVVRQPAQETRLERVYREKRLEVQEWNHKFWSEHNSRFFKDRELYLKQNLPEGKESLGADEMSVFYKAFLDKNWKAHVTYNIEWYKRNFTLLGLAIRVKFSKLFRRSSTV